MVIYFLYSFTVIIVGLSSMSYSVTEGPNAMVSVCGTILLGTAGRDVSVYIFTPVTGSVITGRSVCVCKVHSSN